MVFKKRKVCIDMKRIVIITGANGHLGNTIIRMLAKQDVEIRGLVLEQEMDQMKREGLQEFQKRENMHYYTGNVRDKESLRPMFENTGDSDVYVIHTAGIIDISEHVSPMLYDVNVNGTRNMAALCMEYSVKRMVHVSSVHAIPEKDKLSVLTEVDHFSPESVEGAYAKTKAEASQAVLDMVREGLNAVIVHPSGILGPYDRSGNHLVQMVTDYLEGRLPACVKGGYDFVDVRDVAKGCLLAMDKGRTGECYILSNRHYEIRDVLEMVRRFAGGRRLPVLPMWMAKLAEPILYRIAVLKKERPLYTTYSLYTLEANDHFSHDKATKELGYAPRDLMETMRDTVRWYRRQRG